MSYDPNSQDSMFSRIMEKLDRIEAQTVKTNGRVTSNEAEIGQLKRDREVNKARTAGIAAGVSAVMGAIIWAAKTFL